MLTVAAAVAALMMLFVDPAQAEPALEGPVAYSDIIAEEAGPGRGAGAAGGLTA